MLSWGAEMQNRTSQLISWNICVSPTCCLYIYLYFQLSDVFVMDYMDGHPDMWILCGVDNSPISYIFQLRRWCLAQLVIWQKKSGLE